MDKDNRMEYLKTIYPTKKGYIGMFYSKDKNYYKLLPTKEELSHFKPCDYWWPKNQYPDML